MNAIGKKLIGNNEVQIEAARLRTVQSKNDFREAAFLSRLPRRALIGAVSALTVTAIGVAVGSRFELPTSLGTLWLIVILLLLLTPVILLLIEPTAKEDRHAREFFTSEMKSIGYSLDEATVIYDHLFGKL